MKILKLLVSKVNATGDKFNDYYYITKDEVRLFQFNERNIHTCVPQNGIGKDRRSLYHYLQAINQSFLLTSEPPEVSMREIRQSPL